MKLAIVLWAACGLCCGCASVCNSPAGDPLAGQKAQAQYVRGNGCKRVFHHPDALVFNTTKGRPIPEGGYDIYTCDAAVTVVIESDEVQP